MRWNRKHQDTEGTAWARLRAVPEFARCTDRELELISALATEVRRPAGAVLEAAGHRVRQAVVVLDGAVAERGGAAGVLPGGHLVGGGALYGQLVAPATVVAVTTVRLLVFGPVEIGELAALPGIRAAAHGAPVPAAVGAREPAPVLALA